MGRKSGSKNQEAVHNPQDKIALANLTPSEVIIICEAIDYLCKQTSNITFKTIDDIKTRMVEL